MARTKLPLTDPSAEIHNPYTTINLMNTCKALWDQNPTSMRHAIQLFLLHDKNASEEEANRMYLNAVNHGRFPGPEAQQEPKQYWLEALLYQQQSLQDRKLKLAKFLLFLYSKQKEESLKLALDFVNILQRHSIDIKRLDENIWSPGEISLAALGWGVFGGIGGFGIFVAAVCSLPFLLPASIASAYATFLFLPGPIVGAIFAGGAALVLIGLGIGYIDERLHNKRIEAQRARDLKGDIELDDFPYKTSENLPKTQEVDINSPAFAKLDTKASSTSAVNPDISSTSEPPIHSDLSLTKLLLKRGESPAASQSDGPSEQAKP